MGPERNMGIESGRKREIENTYTPGREYLFLKFKVLGYGS